jgi:hypothetical protein
MYSTSQYSFVKSVQLEETQLVQKVLRRTDLGRTQLKTIATVFIKLLMTKKNNLFNLKQSVN